MRQRKSRPLRTVSNSGALQIQTVRISVKNTTRGLSSRTLHRLSLRVRRAALLAFWPGLPVARWRVGALAGCRAADPPAGRAVGGLAAGRSLWDGPGRRYELRGGRRAVARTRTALRHPLRAPRRRRVYPPYTLYRPRGPMLKGAQAPRVRVALSP